MQEMLLNILKMFETQITFLTQISSDVSALKNVLFALDARAQGLFETQVAAERYKLRSVYEAYRRDIETLRQIISQLPTPKPN